MNELTQTHVQQEDLLAYAGQLISHLNQTDTILADAPIVEMGTSLLPALQLVDMLDHVSDGIFFANPDGTLIFANETLAKITGYEKANLVGNSFAKWLKKDISADILRSIWTTMYEGNAWKGHISGATQFGEALELTLKLNPAVENGKIIGYIGTITCLLYTSPSPRDA